jgi:hypothetical protein
MLVYQRVPTILPISNYPTGLLRVENGDVGMSSHPQRLMQGYISMAISTIFWGINIHLGHLFWCLPQETTRLGAIPREWVHLSGSGKHLDRYNIIYMHIYIYITEKWRFHVIKPKPPKKGILPPQKNAESHPKQRFNHPTGLSGWLDSCFAHWEAAWKICKVSNWVGELGRKFLHPQICEVG